jgi:linoleoyl-CoA desaturase
MQMLIYIPAFSYFIYYPTFKYGFIGGMKFYILQNMIIGFMYGIIFLVSHINEKTHFDNKIKKFDEIQLAETVDWSASSGFWNYLTNGLNHQVVHHLHPHISSYHYPNLVAPIKTKYGKKYKEFPNLLRAIQSNYLYMERMGRNSSSN